MNRHSVNSNFISDLFGDWCKYKEMTTVFSFGDIVSLDVQKLLSQMVMWQKYKFHSCCSSNEIFF